MYQITGDIYYEAVIRCGKCYKKQIGRQPSGKEFMTINLLNQGDKWKKPLLAGYDTKRLKIRTLKADDFIAISKISMDLELYSFVSGIKNGYESEKWIKSVYKKRNYLFFSVKEKICSLKGKTYNNKDQADNLIGLIILNRSSDLKIEFGGWIGKKYQKKGYAFELAKELIIFVKKENKFFQLYADIKKENILARKVLIKAGFYCKEANQSCATRWFV